MLGLGTLFNGIGSVSNWIGGGVDTVAGWGDGLIQGTLGNLPLIGGPVSFLSNAAFGLVGGLVSLPFDLIGGASNWLGNLLGGGGGGEAQLGESASAPVVSSRSAPVAGTTPLGELPSPTTPLRVPSGSAGLSM